MDANRAAIAANHAYRAGDLEQARQLIDQAATLDPSRAGLWQQHREQIAARRLILDARAAHAAGDQQRADKLLGDARELDPRMPAIWDGDLHTSLPARLASRSSVREAPASGPRLPPTANRLATRADAAAPQPGISAQADQDSPRPSSSARSHPQQPESSPAADSGSSSAPSSARRQPDRDFIQGSRRMTQTPAPRQPPATWHVGRRPIPVSPARTYGRKSKFGQNRVPASRRTGNSVSPAPQPRQNRSMTATLSGRQHPMPTGVTRFSAKPVSRDSLARSGLTVPPCTIRPKLVALMSDLSQAGDLASTSCPRSDRPDFEHRTRAGRRRISRPG